LPAGSASDIFAPILRGLRRNLVPGLLLQFLALALVVTYFGSDKARAWFDTIGALKYRLGYLFSALSTLVFGGIIPFFVLLATGRADRTILGRTLVFYILFWTWKGIEVDGFYRLQAIAFGNSTKVAVIAKKIVVDQLLYNPLWAGPTQVWFFLWKECRFSRRAMRPCFAEQSLWRRVVIVVVSSWIVWVPTVAIIYALPSSLQVPLFNIIICFWSLLLSSLSKREDSGRPSAGSQISKPTLPNETLGPKMNAQ
jgi:hypothetical protein